MIKTEAIKSVNNESMSVTWDTGRRCNYDCSYCEVSRHDNYSQHHSLEEYIKTFEFIKQWTDVYDQHKKFVNHTNINFTGGEPTINPAFWDLVDIIKEDSRDFYLSLTTNGAWNKKYSDKILKRFDSITISYHTEGHPKLKKQVLENIQILNSNKIRLQVNLMMHTDHWKECVDVYYMLKKHDVSVKIRPIGDGNIERKGWFIDSDGSQRRTSHEYTNEQQQWYYSELNINSEFKQNKLGTDLGRGCCGGRCLTGKINGEWQKINIVDTKFKDWSCMVDWFFLHIDQHTGLIYHHQTCQALHNQKRGSLGSIEDADIIIEQLKERMKHPTPIICPNQRCGCGMCVPKARENSDFEPIWKSIVR